MLMHDERYVLSISDDHQHVRLRDQRTGEIHELIGSKALYDALGILAEWRERDLPSQPKNCPTCGDDGQAHEQLIAHSVPCIDRWHQR